MLFCLGFVWVLFVVFCFHRHLDFLLTYSPTCGNSQSKTKRFYDRLSFERARHGPKKKFITEGSNAPHKMFQIVEVHATNHQATKVHLTGKHGTWKKPFETVSKPLSSRNQNKFPSLTPRTTKHFQCFSYHPKTSLFQKTNRQKTYVPQNQSSRKYP